MSPELYAVSWHRHARAFNGSSTNVASTSATTSSPEATTSASKDATTELHTSTSSTSGIFTSSGSLGPVSSSSSTNIISSTSTSSSRSRPSTSRTFTKHVSTSNSLTVTSVLQRSKSGSSSRSPKSQTGKTTSASCFSLPCDPSSERRVGSLMPTLVLTLNCYASQISTLTIPLTTFYPSTSASMSPSSSHGHGSTHPTSSVFPSSSGVLFTNSPDGNTSFSRNTGAILGVAIAAVVFLISLTVILFFVCRRLRRRRAKDGTGSSHSTHHLTSGLGRSGSFRSPIDGDDAETFSGPYGDILAAMQLPKSTPSEVTCAPHSEDTCRSYEQSSTLSHHRSSTAPRMQQSDQQRTPVAFPMQKAYDREVGSEDDSPHLISYPHEVIRHPSYSTMSRSSPNLPLANGADPFASPTSHYATPHLPAPPPAHTIPDLIITVDSPIRSPIPWLYRLSSSTLPLRRDASRSSPSVPSRDNSPTRVPDGLLHPLLAQRAFTQPGSARTFLDNVDYSRPISGVHARVDSITTFTTQGTGEADLGHEPDA